MKQITKQLQSLRIGLAAKLANEVGSHIGWQANLRHPMWFGFETRWALDSQLRSQLSLTQVNLRESI